MDYFFFTIDSNGIRIDANVINWYSVFRFFFFGCYGEDIVCVAVTTGKLISLFYLYVKDKGNANIKLRISLFRFGSDNALSSLEYWTYVPKSLEIDIVPDDMVCKVCGFLQHMRGWKSRNCVQVQKYVINKTTW